MSLASVSFVRLGSYERQGRARYALLLAAICVFVIYKSWLIGPSRLVELWLGTAFEIAVWSLAWLLGEAIAGRRHVLRERVAALLFMPFLYASAALVFAHTWFYDAAIERRLTALDLSLHGVRGFFHELPARGYVALALLVTAMHLLAFLFSVNLKRPRFRRALLAIAGLSLLSFSASALAPRTPSVLFDTAQELWQLATLPRVVPTPVVRVAQRKAALDKSPLPTLPSPRFKKVIVLVMETMTSDLLARERPKLAAGSFFRSQESHAHQYTRYFPNNQDSRTGMLGMLGSRLIPYEAYSAEGLAGYERLSGVESLVDHLRLMGYRSAFAVSQVALEEVVSDLKWDELLHLDGDEIAQLKKKKLLCFEPDVWERSCEDLALLPRLADFMAKSERAFAYQEFVWGHAYDYNAASGKTNTAYYSAYVDALIAELRARGMLSETLIAITSDHGFRDKSRQGELGAYRIPLWFWAERFSEKRDARLLSHLDFKDLLFDELAESQRFTTPNERVLIVGPTGTGMLTAILQDGGFVWMRERFGRHLLMAHRRGGTARELGPGQLLYLFERYRADFDRALRGK